MASSMATAASIPAASVSLHPLASRDGQHSSTIVSLTVPQDSCQQDGLPPLEEIQATLDAPMACDEHDQRQQHNQTPPSPLTPRDGQHLSGPGPYAKDADSDDDDDVEQPRVWGIQHEDINQYPIIEDQPAMCTCIEDDNLPSIFSVEDAPPIRAMTAAQLVELHKQYLSLDVPHSVVFPFLHGVDGSNPAQNHFFKAPAMGQPSPNYRGLTIVRADMPTPAQQERSAARRKRTSSVGSKLSMSCINGAQQQSHGRHDSVANSSVSSHCANSSVGAVSIDGRTTASDGSEGHSTGHRKSAAYGTPLSATGSSASISSSMGSSDMSGNSLFSHDHHDGRYGSLASFDTGHTDFDEDMAASANGKADGSQRQSSPTDSYDPQPEACLLTSSLYPYELITPPVMVDRRTGSCYYARSGTQPRRNESAMVHTAQFNQPDQAAGVNLRNFKIQAVKYATISDIVIYCPTGYHEGLLTFARWFRDAHEGSYDARCERGLWGLRYNVFIVTEPFDVFEHHYPHLVAIDSAGVPRNRVDFIDRERQEMQRLTAASAIDENVWLGCTGDCPGLTDKQQDGVVLPIAANAPTNEHGFSVCIEFDDKAEAPTTDKLLQATHLLDLQRSGEISASLEEAWLPESPIGRPFSPGLTRQAGVIGSNRLAAASRSKLDLAATAEQSPRLSPEEGVVHLECHSFSLDPRPKPTAENANGKAVDPQAEAREQHLLQQKKVEEIIRLCTWIQSQAQPSKSTVQASTPSPSAGQHGSIAGALKNSRQHASGSFGRGSARREAYIGGAPSPSLRKVGRRVLLHCGDGYTETSILALAYLMYAKGMSLPEAYLDLQNRAKRSFFVYNRDVPLLKELERQIDSLRKDAVGDGAVDHNTRSRTKHGFPWLGAEEGQAKRRNASSTSTRRNSVSSPGQDPNEHNSWMRGLVGWVGAANKRSNPVNNSSDGLLSPPSRTVTPTPASMASRSSPNVASASDASTGSLVGSPGANTEPAQSHAWFHSPRFEGSFPSRILPFLYLGNLNHALNAGMLHALGITHVVSVGESALHPPAASGSAVADSSGGQTTLPSPADPEDMNLLWHEQQAGRISVLDLKNVSDDGIDPLRSTMRRAVEYIECARRSGGKVLVHCRVGVSRSTTIVLAYVMAHLDLTLVESYLLVRSRRLSILIQPHLLFFWELRGWESYVASQKLKRRLALESRKSTEGETGDTGAMLADAHFSLAGLSLRGDAVRGELMERISTVGASCGFGPSDGSDGAIQDLDVDIGQGAKSPYGGVPDGDVMRVPFGSGSPANLPAEALRLNWGFLCREITALNERYF